ncbi:hypothetical protein CHS0354_023891 [Potamilus streckersoni]|uniref:Gcp-like domain-containing protein n=1 Tax=Potamilus streckersoni TaxID=2493646 RepID=A0AAE0RZD3_9BIVA|nr:hypothetical protein CHS0354_023891 [Potamilus streckersoni]
MIAIDSCELPISVALLNEYHIHEKQSTNPINHSSDALMPMLIDLLCELNLTTHSIDVWIVSNGPGSYTGLRIANAIVKGIISKEDIETKRKDETFIVGSQYYTEVDLSFTATHFFDLGKKKFQENKFSNQALFTPQYDLKDKNLLND